LPRPPFAAAAPAVGVPEDVPAAVELEVVLTANPTTTASRDMANQRRCRFLIASLLLSVSWAAGGTTIAVTPGSSLMPTTAGGD
jgi:hypothetical protein